MFTALVLDGESRDRLMARFRDEVPDGWEWACNHMTINLGGPNQGPARGMVGRRYDLIVRTFAIDDQVCAVGVESSCPSVNAAKHVTIAFDEKGGGRPKHSKGLTYWRPTGEPLRLHGTIRVVS